MYADLADAVEHFREQGFTHSFEIEKDKIVCKDLGEEYKPGDIKIVESYRHERMTDPGTDETVFAISTSTGTKGILVAAFGMYVEQDKADMIDRLLRSQEKTQ